MGLRVSTVSEDVFLFDLGIILTHPTIARDLSLEFSAIDLKRSTNLTQAIQNGLLLVDDGTYTIYASDYDPDEVLIQQLGYKDDILYVSEAELISRGDVYLKPNIFPLSLNSTAAATDNIYCPTARWITWDLSPGDKIVITNCDAAGVYTVASISDQQNFITVESIIDSTGGNISAFHPDAATRIGVDDEEFEYIEGSTLHECLASIDDQLGDTTSGITVGTHRSLDQLVHLIAEDSFEEITYSGVRPVSLIIWTDDNKVTKIREEQYTWNANKIDTLTTIQYNESGIEEERLIETYTYSGIKVISIDRELI